MKKTVLLFILLLSLSIIGCGNDASIDEDKVEASNEVNQQDDGIFIGEGWQSEYYDPETMNGIELNMYSVTDGVEPILREFEEDTGIKISHLSMRNAEMLQRIQHEYDSGVVIADLWFTGGADTFINASQNDLLIPYKSPNGEMIDDLMKCEEGYWHGTSLTLVNWVVNIDLIEEIGIEVPKVWDDLLQEELIGEISMPDPSSSGTGYNVISAMIEVKGEEDGWQYLEKLNRSVPFYSARGSDPAQHVINGEAIVGINPSNGDLNMEEENEHIKIVFPEDGTGWWPQPVAIVNGTEKEEACKVFIDWILSERGMESIARNRHAAVSNPNVNVPEGIISIDDITLFETDFQSNAENREEILDKWEELLRNSN